MRTDLIKPPKGWQPLSPGERAEISRVGLPRMLLMNRRSGWMLEMAERHQVVPVRGSHRSYCALANLLLPDLFRTHHQRPYVRDRSDLELARSLLGPDVRRVQAQVPGHGEVGLDVGISPGQRHSDAAARVRALGLKTSV